MEIKYCNTGVTIALIFAVFSNSTFAKVSDGFKLVPASVTYGPYIRLEEGNATANFSDEHWLPSGYPDDPRIDFDLNGKNRLMLGGAIGYDWMNGFRADMGIVNLARTEINGVHTTTGSHGDISSASVATTALMANVFYSPLEQLRVNSRIQPFIVAGLGYAHNRVGDWTRINTGSSTVERTYYGMKHGDLATTIGAGVSIQLTPPGVHPVILELAYRYYDFGTAKGSSTPMSGSSYPVEPLTFENKSNVFSLNIRIPLQRL